MHYTKQIFKLAGKFEKYADETNVEFNVNDRFVSDTNNIVNKIIVNFYDRDPNDDSMIILSEKFTPANYQSRVSSVLSDPKIKELKDKNPKLSKTVDQVVYSCLQYMVVHDLIINLIDKLEQSKEYGIKYITNGKEISSRHQAAEKILLENINNLKSKYPLAFKLNDEAEFIRSSARGLASRYYAIGLDIAGKGSSGVGPESL